MCQVRINIPSLRDGLSPSPFLLQTFGPAGTGIDFRLLIVDLGFFILGVNTVRGETEGSPRLDHRNSVLYGRYVCRKRGCGVRRPVGMQCDVWVRSVMSC